MNSNRSRDKSRKTSRTKTEPAAESAKKGPAASSVDDVQQLKLGDIVSTEWLSNNVQRVVDAIIDGSFWNKDKKNEETPKQTTKRINRWLGEENRIKAELKENVILVVSLISSNLIDKNMLDEYIHQQAQSMTLSTTQTINDSQPYAVSSTVVSTLPKPEPDASRRSKLVAKEHRLFETARDTTGTTKSRLEARFSKQEADNLAVHLLALSFEERKEHFLWRCSLAKTGDKPDEDFFFYGTDEGQRMCVALARFMFDKHPLRMMDENEKKQFAVELYNHATQAMAGGDKEKWREVSNYWLSPEGELGIIGHRKMMSEDFKPAGEHERAKFLKGFFEAQVALNRKWDIDSDEHVFKSAGKVSKVARLEDLITRRMCKWILHWATCEKNKTIIYSLDGMDLAPVARMDQIKLVKEDKIVVPVCTSELREIFRHIDKFQGSVQFYEKLQIKPPPWGKGRDKELLKDWAEYAMHLTRKLLVRYPGDALCLKMAREMCAEWKKGDFENVIVCYQALKPSELLEPVSPCLDKMRKIHVERVKKAISNEVNPLVKNNAYIAAQEILELIGAKAKSDVEAKPGRLPS